MNDSLELPLNKDVRIISGVTSAGLDAIVTSEEYVGENNVKISDLIFVENGKQYNYFSKKIFSNELNGVILKEDKLHNCIGIKSHPFLEKKNAYIYKKIHIKKESNFAISFKLDFFQNSNAWNYIRIQLSECNLPVQEKNGGDLTDLDCYLQINLQGKMEFGYGSFYIKKKLPGIVDKMPIYFELTIGSHIVAKYSFDGVNWEFVGEVEKDDLSGEKQLGIYIAPNVSPFFYEFFINQLQLCYSKATRTIVPQTNMEERYFTNMLAFYHIPKEIVDIYAENIIAYYANILSKKYYIRLLLDEFFVPDRGSYQIQHFIHTNFIYGYDKRKKIFKLMGFNKYIVFSEISFEEFIKASQYEEKLDNKIMICKYSSKKQPDKFNINKAIKILKAYLSGENCYAVSGQRLIYDDRNMSQIYGIKIIDFILENDEELLHFIKDIRIPNLMQERYTYIVQMLEFLKYNKGLQNEECMMHFAAFKELVNLSEILKNLLLKNKIKALVNIEYTVKNKLMKLKQKDEKATWRLIEYLEVINSPK